MNHLPKIRIYPDPNDPPMSDFPLLFSNKTRLDIDDQEIKGWDSISLELVKGKFAMVTIKIMGDVEVVSKKESLE